ncbi:MAG: MBL fold metallo-hydrolase [Chloroflexi bacterium]|nr:MBL fold metallo-hydrolase [Chloroflexota bacterium]
MPRIIALGTSAALPHNARENTYLLLDGKTRSYLIDCAGSPVQRLRQVGVALDRLEGLIVTHHHPDHIYGVPTLLTSLWLSGRQRPFHIYGPEKSIHILQAISELMEWDEWTDWLPVVYHGVPAQEGAGVLDGPEFRITGSPGEHLAMTTLALRMESRQTGSVAVYSSDTGPCDAVVRLAQGADLLIHEATGPHQGHSSAAQAGAVARQAQVGRLVLVHYPRSEDAPLMMRQAKEEFAGPVEVAEDLAVYEF